MHFEDCYKRCAFGGLKKLIMDGDGMEDIQSETWGFQEAKSSWVEMTVGYIRGWKWRTQGKFPRMAQAVRWLSGQLTF